MNVSLRAGKPAGLSMLVNVSKLVTAYYTDAPGPSGPKRGAENYAENFRGADPLRHIMEEAQAIVGDALEASPQQPGIPSEPTLKEHL